MNELIQKRITGCGDIKNNNNNHLFFGFQACAFKNAERERERNPHKQQGKTDRLNPL